MPEGRSFRLEIIPHPDGSCGVIKDAGDDPGVTNGMEVRLWVELSGGDGDISFVAGEGVGTVTGPGLKLGVGEAAINPVLRQMIADAVRSVFGERAVRVPVSILGGEELARHTFNPRLGIEGGLSLLGISGIVCPMSEQALKDALRVELEMRVSQGHNSLLFTFGNQGDAETLSGNVHRAGEQ